MSDWKGIAATTMAVVGAGVLLFIAFSTTLTTEPSDDEQNVAKLSGQVVVLGWVFLAALVFAVVKLIIDKRSKKPLPCASLMEVPVKD